MERLGEAPKATRERLREDVLPAQGFAPAPTPDPIRVAIVSGNQSLVCHLAENLTPHAVELLDGNSGGMRSDAVPDAVIVEDNPLLDAIMATLKATSTSMLGIVLLGERHRRDERVAALSNGIDHILPRSVDAAELAAILHNLARFSRVGKDHAGNEAVCEGRRG